MDGIGLEYYFPEGKRNDVTRYFGETVKMMKVFGELTGIKYPYAKYAQTTVEDFIYGGMENISATTLATTYYPNERSEEDFQVSYSREGQNAVNLVAHELAHQWFRLRYLLSVPVPGEGEGDRLSQVGHVAEGRVLFR